MFTNTTINHPISLQQMTQLKLRYGCYLRVLNITSEMTKLLSKKDNFNFYFVICCGIFAAINICSNVILIYGLIKANTKLNFVQKLFVYLSCIDLTAGMVIIPILIYYQLVGLTCLYMTLMMCLVGAVVVGDSSIVLTISILRLQAIKYPLEHKVGVVKKCILLVSQIFLLVIVSVAFYITYYIKGTIEVFQLIGYLSNGVVSSFTIGILACVLYTLVEIRKHKKNDSNVLHQSMFKNHKKSAGSLLIIGCFMLFFIVVQVPSFYIIHTLLRGSGVLSGETFRTTKRVVDISILINLLNTIINSIVILGRSRRIKRYYRKAFINSFNFQSETEDPRYSISQTAGLEIIGKRKSTPFLQLNTPAL